MLVSRSATQLQYYGPRRWLANAFPVAAATNAHAQSVTPPRAGLARGGGGASTRARAQITWVAGLQLRPGRRPRGRAAGRASETAPLAAGIASAPLAPRFRPWPRPRGPQPSRRPPLPAAPHSHELLVPRSGRPFRSRSRCPRASSSPSCSHTRHAPGPSFFPVPLYPPFPTSGSEWVRGLRSGAEWSRR